jgi:hypothetical protein
MISRRAFLGLATTRLAGLTAAAGLSTALGDREAAAAPLPAPADRYVIVNADDFGGSHGINRGVVEACERGVVTSASLMVTWPWAAEAVRLAREYSHLGLRLHVAFSRDGRWMVDRDYLRLCPKPSGACGSRP